MRGHAAAGARSPLVRLLEAAGCTTSAEILARIEMRSRERAAWLGEFPPTPCRVPAPCRPRVVPPRAEPVGIFRLRRCHARREAALSGRLAPLRSRHRVRLEAI